MVTHLNSQIAVMWCDANRVQPLMTASCASNEFFTRFLSSTMAHAYRIQMFQFSIRLPKRINPLFFLFAFSRSFGFWLPRALLSFVLFICAPGFLANLKWVTGRGGCFLPWLWLLCSSSVVYLCRFGLYGGCNLCRCYHCHLVPFVFCVRDRV